MILDDAKGVRKAQEQQEQDDSQVATGTHPAEQAHILLAPPAYEPRSLTSSSSPPELLYSEGSWSQAPSQAGPSNSTAFAAIYPISSSSSSQFRFSSPPASPTPHTPLLRSIIPSSVSNSPRWYGTITSNSSIGDHNLNSSNSNQKRESTRTRFIKALCIALLVYGLIGLSSIKLALAISNSRPRQRGPFLWVSYPHALPLCASDCFYKL
ncbi:hypothetical protein DL93DRAFT_2230280 [Clavulina sp. PMI_390]|nr:hypothetical protein DL93DRAFT_2230280 [Clavulina sp. PMI_390]